MEEFDFSLDRGSEVPLGTQLVWRLRMLIASGALAPGARLPGVRETAEAAGVNVNTVRSVFARLEEQGLLASEHGRGTFVGADVRPDAALAQLASEAFADARKAGIDPRELAAILYASPERSVAPTTRRGAARATNPGGSDADEGAQRRQLRAEIVHLERELTKLEPLAPLAERKGSGGGRILTAAELRETRDALAERVEELRLQRQEDRAAAERERMEDEALERQQHQPRAPRWRNAGVWTGGSATGVSWTTG